MSVSVLTDLAAVVADLAPPSGAAPESVKRAALAALVRAALARHDEAYLDPSRVATEVDARALLGATEADARRLMGTPARYAEVLWRGAQDPSELGLDGSAVDVTHVFMVAVYWGAEPGSETAFTAAMEGHDEARPGVLTALRALGSVYVETVDEGQSSGHVLTVGPPRDVRVTLVPARPSTPGIAGYQHEAAWLQSIT